mmetsp:Transcript_12551/g.34715  ORF Transcript_12551/g.34715 Transcript_12551/m.34715 type:complete len:533 (-) Transcript_12551:270-1868(-)
MLGKLATMMKKEDESDPYVSGSPSRPGMTVPGPRDDYGRIDTSLFVPPGQKIIHEGLVWKLNHNGDPRDASAWLKRKMWLTSAGGLFYYSLKYQKFFGRHIRGLKVRPTPCLDGAYGFEVCPPKMGASTLNPTILATDTAEERAAWQEHLNSFEGQSSYGDDLSPLDVFGNHRGRPGRRSSISSCSSGYDGAGEGFEEAPLHDLEPVSAHSTQSRLSNTIGSPGNLFTAVAPGRRNSQAGYAEKNNTALILDWDDTIFPTTWVRDDCGMNWRLPLDQQLEREGRRRPIIQGLLAKLLDRAELFFKEATQLANCFIVTLARRPWVDASMENFLPGLSKIINMYNLKVIYAQEYITDALSAEYAKGDEFKASEEVEQFWIRVKAEAISKELEDFYKRQQASWKNIISFGDSNFERYGTQAAGKDYMRKETEGGMVFTTGSTAEGISKDGHLRKLRTKTLKMLSDPTVEEMTAEMTLLTRWLPHMVRQDTGFDIEIDNTDDDDKLQALHKHITGEDARLSWMELAGLTSQAHRGP